MRLVIATCSADYRGRLSAHLPTATRLLLVKADGSVSIHADDRAYKPLNWMSPPCRLVEEPGRWVVTNPRGETLIVTIEVTHSDISHDLGVDPGLEKDAVAPDARSFHATTADQGPSMKANETASFASRSRLRNVIEPIQWMGTREACERLGVTLRTLYRFIDEGQLPAYKMGRVIRLQAAELDAFIERTRIQPGSLEHLYPEPRSTSSGEESDPNGKNE